jgi:hypothetical protein
MTTEESPPSSGPSSPGEADAIGAAWREAVVADTMRWVERAVIGLGLCPFAGPVHRANRIRYVVTDATTIAALADVLATELERLAEADPEAVETTLIVHPRVLADFLDYNDFLADADAIVADMGLEGVMQVASFHPDYRFEGTAPDDVENCTSRSPYPTLHLLREESVERALEAHPDPERIVPANVETLRRLGREGWVQLGVGPAKK